MGDNMGGGAPADGTVLAHAILRHRACPAFVSINDPEAHRDARRSGAGTELTLRIGGKHDDKHGAPIVTIARIISLHDGTFVEPNPSHGGWSRFDMGPTAIVETPEGLTIQITSRRTLPVSLRQLTSCGLDPAKFRILVAKGVNAPVAAYKAVCSTIIRVNTPGVTTADMTTLRYQHRRRPLFPFEEV
jgi:microcystin degradation protein MlrC